MMAETWCGKTCADCEVRAEQKCPGCMYGPGRRLGGSCEIYRCCATKGHETCLTCTQHSSCGTYRRRLRMPEERRRQLEREAAEQMKMAQRAPIFGKWLWILFWLVVPSEIAGLMTNDTVAELLPGLYLAGRITGIVCSVAYALILLKLSEEEYRYRTAAICHLVNAAVSTLIVILGADGETWTLVLSLPVMALSLVAVYQEFMAHAAVLDGFDDAQAEQWRNLWNWYLGLSAATVLCLLLIVIVPVIGALAVLAAGIAMVVVEIMQMVYLYRTAQLFRRYPTETVPL